MSSFGRALDPRELTCSGRGLAGTWCWLRHDASVTMEEMIPHAARCAGSGRAFVIFDMPFLSYQGVEEAVRNAGRAMKETGCKL